MCWWYSYLLFNETRFQEGASNSTFGEDFGYDGKKILSKNSYKIFGNSINNLINNKILDIPDYIKIDVDGIEHLILEGANKYLSDKKIKSILVEVNEEFEEQLSKVNEILLNNDFKLISKNKRDNQKVSKFMSQRNYIFSKI